MRRVNHDRLEGTDVRESDETRERITGPAASEGEGPVSTPTQRLGLVAGLALFVLMRLWPEPAGLSGEGWAVAGVAILMAVWWVTEAVPIPVTAMLPLALFPLLGVATMARAAAPYANQAIYLFMGGFFIGKAIEKWSLHRRIALAIIVRIGTSPRRLLFGVMAATALVSMWISNTATATMMLPIALAVGHMFRPPDYGSTPQKPYNFGVALMLGVAYAASIGGVGTLIGTPPNVLFAAAAYELLGVRVSLFQWMMVGVPLTCIMLPLAWLIILKFYPPEELSGDAHAAIQAQQKLIGPPSRAERFVGLVFALTVFAWIMREPKVLGAVSVPGITTFLPGVTDGTIAMLSALVLFVVPLDWRRGQVALDWGTAATIPWGRPAVVWWRAVSGGCDGEHRPLGMDRSWCRDTRRGAYDRDARSRFGALRRSRRGHVEYGDDRDGAPRHGWDGRSPGHPPTCSHGHGCDRVLDGVLPTGRHASERDRVRLGIRYDRSDGAGRDLGRCAEHHGRYAGRHVLAPGGLRILKEVSPGLARPHQIRAS